MKHLKVLMVAYACEPCKGSEPGVGWNWAVQAARIGHEVHVITRKNNRKGIEAEGHPSPETHLFFHYIDFPPSICSLKKRLGYFALPIYYYCWQFLVWRKAKELTKLHGFDLVHHVTFVIDWLPSGLCLLPIPFIWGPVGGSTHFIPPIIRTHLPVRARIEEALRRFVQNTMKYCDPLLSLTKRRAQLILVYTTEGLAGIPLKYRDKTRVIAHIGVNAPESPKESHVSQTFPQSSDFNVLSNGRLVPWKGHDLLISGFARFLDLTNHSSHLIITGEGPYRSHLESMVQASGHSDKISLIGHLPSRNDVYQILNECDIYALLTSRDGPPVAMIEAMHSGCPILCLDTEVTKELVPSGAKVAIPLNQSNYIQLVEAIALKLKWAFSNRQRLPEMGQVGKRFITKRYTWDGLGEKLREIYEYQYHASLPIETFSAKSRQHFRQASDN